MSESALKDAQEAVRRARQAEDVGYDQEAEEHWDDAERLYEQAGLDPTWLDDARLAGELDEPNDTLDPLLEPLSGKAVFAEDLVADPLNPVIEFDPEKETKWIAFDPDLIEQARR